MTAAPDDRRALLEAARSSLVETMHKHELKQALKYTFEDIDRLQEEIKGLRLTPLEVIARDTLQRLEQWAGTTPDLGLYKTALQSLMGLLPLPEDYDLVVSLIPRDRAPIEVVGPF